MLLSFSHEPLTFLLRLLNDDSENFIDKKDNNVIVNQRQVFMYLRVTANMTVFEIDTNIGQKMLICNLISHTSFVQLYPCHLIEL